MKVIIDRSECIGCGLCTEICPEIFRMDNDDLAEIYAEVDDSLKDSAVEAQDSCPVSAISLED